MVWFGVENYKKAVVDPIFWVSLRNNIVWIIASIVSPMAVGLVLAVLLASVCRFRKIFETIYFMPVVLSLVVVGIIWGWIYNPIFGIFNVMLETVGLGNLARGWLGDPFWAVPAVILAGNWTYFGFCMVIFLAGLQNIDKGLYEAAMLDGANRVTLFFRITIPSLRNEINLLIVYSLIGSFKVFDIVYVMTEGGPFHSTEVLATHAYRQAFELSYVGYGCSIAMYLALVVFALSFTFLSTRERGA
jgi:ABC-type sugar transport system permease subunit